jgi:hypothetical protein
MNLSKVVRVRLGHLKYVVRGSNLNSCVWRKFDWGETHVCPTSPPCVPHVFPDRY